jgi:hypothetical protein
MSHNCTNNPYCCGNIAPVGSTIPEKHVEEAEGTGIVPEPTVTGNDKIAITKHQLLEIQVYVCLYKVSVEFAVKNISDVTISTLVFEATFYDKTGKELETETHRELDLRPGVNRGIVITSHTTTPGTVKSYNVRISKMTTTDTEKVQLRQQNLKVDDATGEAEISGTVKNISNVKTGAAMLVTFGNHKKETIGDKVLIIRDIEPDKLKKFSLKYQPVAGEDVDNFSIRLVSNIAEMPEEAK